MKRIVPVSIVGLIILFGVYGDFPFETRLGSAPAYAEEEDDERGGENDSAPSASTSTAPAQSKKKATVKYENVIEYRPVTRNVTVTEPAFEKDTDNDGLVDGLDPDPNVDQRQYFTDDDHDSMPNVWDRYPGEDDFSYLDDQSDTDHNGLIDAYESH